MATSSNESSFSCKRRQAGISNLRGDFSQMVERCTYTIVNGSEHDERVEKIRPQASNSGESDVHRTQVQGLTSLTRLISVQKLCDRQIQDIHFFHQVHFEVHLIEPAVEALTTSKKTSFTSFIVVSGVKE